MVGIYSLKVICYFHQWGYKTIVQVRREHIKCILWCMLLCSYFVTRFHNEGFGTCIPYLWFNGPLLDSRQAELASYEQTVIEQFWNVWCWLCYFLSQMKQFAGVFCNNELCALSFLKMPSTMDCVVSVFHAFLAVHAATKEFICILNYLQAWSHNICLYMHHSP